MRKLVAAGLIGALVLILVKFLGPGPKPALSVAGLPASAPEPVKTFCDLPKPEYTKLPGEKLRPKRPAAAVLADADKVWNERDKPATLALLKRASDIREDLQNLHGDPECRKAEDALWRVKIVEQNTVEAVGKQRMAMQLANDASGRKAYAERLETNFLKDGRDAVFTVSGPKNTVLTMKYVLINRPFVYKIQNESTFISDAKERGFAKVVLTDGFSNSWTWDLTK